MAAKRKEAPRLSNLHFVHGTDDARVKEAALALVRELAPAEAGEFGIETIDGAADNADHAGRICAQAIEGVQTLPFFGGGKVVWLKGVNFLADSVTGRAESTQQALLRLLGVIEAGIPGDVQFIVSAGASDKRRTFYLRLSELARVQVFDVPEPGSRGAEAQIEALVSERAKAAGLGFEPEAMALFLALAGERTQQIINEVEKLDLYLGPERREITVDDVRALVPLSRVGVIFELGNAIGRRDASRALALVRPLLEQGESAIGLLLAAIVPKMRNLLLVGDLIERFHPPLDNYAAFQRCLENLPAAEVAHLPRKKDGGLNVYPFFLAGREASNFTATELRAGLQACLRANQRLISSSLAPEVVLSQLIVQLTVGAGRTRSPAAAV